MDMYVYVVIDSEHDGGYVALCTSYNMACTMAMDYVYANYDCDHLENCENVWIEKIPLNEWL